MVKLRHLSIFQVTLVWDSEQIRTFRASARQHIFVRTSFFCSPVRWFIALSLKLTSSDYLCAVISFIIWHCYYRIYRIVTRTSSCHTFKEAKANGGSTQLSSPSYSPFIVSFRRVGGILVMKLTHKGDRERPSKSLGLENTFTHLGVTGRSPTVCLHSKSSETPLQHQASLSSTSRQCLRAAPASIYRHSRIHRQINYLTYNSYHLYN